MRWRAARLRVLAWLLRRTHRDFPGRWRVERFAVREVRSVGPRLRPVVVRTRDGFCIEADPAEWVGQYVYVTGRYEEHTAALMARLLQPGDRFVDVGANIGYLTLHAARLVGPSGSVLAFEPLASARESLVRNVALNRASHVSVLGDAVSDRTGTTVLNIGPEHHTSTSSLLQVAAGLGEVAVPSVRLDDAISDSPRVRLIKIDVEGAEQLVLDGAGRVLDLHEPDIIVELNGPEADRALRHRGYAAFAIDGAPLGQVNGQINAYFTKREAPRTNNEGAAAISSVDAHAAARARRPS